MKLVFKHIALAIITHTQELLVMVVIYAFLIIDDKILLLLLYS